MFMNCNLFEPGKSRSEKQFVQVSAKQNQRFDGRRCNEWRDVELTFGADWGVVAVSLMDTKVLAQVSCDLGTPTTARPNEGKLQLNVSIGGVAFLDEVQSTYDQRLLALNSQLERIFRNSRCLDLESLCVAAEKHVWCIRVDINVLNHDGSLYDACTIATLAALMHFRRPDVTYADDELRIYTEKERELIPLLFLHYPVSVTYCIYKGSSQPLVDPTLLEENAADSVIVLSFNSYQELCTLNVGGSAPTNVRTIMQCARNAATRCKAMVEFIRKTLAADEERRLQSKGPKPGLGALLGENKQKYCFKPLMKGYQKQETPSLQDSPMEVDAAAPVCENPKVGKVSLTEEQPKKQEVDKLVQDAVSMDTGTWLPQDPTDEQELPTTSKAAASQAAKAKKRAKNKANKR
ncbi:hypothetical protein KR038_005790, partial [Drosophila bunnanda]